jgi:hypothetical protein
MKKKELKNLAKRIAEAETTIQNSDDADEIYEAEQLVVELSSHVKSVEEMLLLDDMIQDIIEKT